MRFLLKLSIAAVVGWWLWVSWMPIHRPPGVLISTEPDQLMLEGPQTPVSKKGWVLKPLAMYSIQARVLSKEHYSGDKGAELVPYDVAVGWGPMSDSAVIDKLDISQSFRFYYWRCSGAPPVPSDQITTHSANMHLIPDNDDIESTIASLRTGSLVVMRGYLVEALNPAALRPWRSSLRRDDTGDGACEVMLVTSLREL